MNVRVVNALRKIAGDKWINPEYLHDRRTAFFNTLYDFSDNYERRYDKPRLRVAQSLHGPDDNNYRSDIIKYRPKRARGWAKDYFNLTPGSDEYNEAVKYLINRGETNMYNFDNPSNPKPNPQVPKILKDKEHSLKNIGNIMASANRNKYGGNA